jgi:RsiW-degrading membrane proteinase PrsW (M82 family)
MELMITLALLPSLIIAFLLYISDKKEREPITELIKAFFLGIISIIITLGISFIFDVTKIEVDNLDMIGLAIYSFIDVALIEELSKWLMAHIFVRNNSNYNYMYDGIIYFSYVSLGFATIENILYIASTGLTAALVRAVTTVPSHVFFAMTAGYYYTLATKEKNNKALRSRYFILSIVMPVLLHGFFDFCLLTKNYLFLLIFLVFVVSLYIVSIGNARKVEKNDRLIEE